MGAVVLTLPLHGAVTAVACHPSEAVLCCGDAAGGVTFPDVFGLGG